MALFDLELALEGAVPGLMLEFGVAGGKSINSFARRCGGRVFYGFDSFEGLPEDWVTRAGRHAARGTFGCSVPRVLGNVELVIGLFQETLEPFLAHHTGPVAFAHMDADLYSSTVYVLERLAGRFVIGSLLAFDEINGRNGECDAELWAFLEYRVRTGQRWELLGEQGTQGRTYRLRAYK